MARNSTLTGSFILRVRTVARPIEEIKRGRSYLRHIVFLAASRFFLAKPRPGPLLVLRVRGIGAHGYERSASPDRADTPLAQYIRLG